MQPPETIETARLVLRRPRLEDAEAIFANYAQDPDVTRYVTWAPHPDVAVTRQFVASRQQAWDTGETFEWVITRRPDDVAIGMFALRVQDFKANLGYVLAKPHWGQGLMTEVARAIVDWAMAQPEIYRVWAVCDVDNPASARVMEKCGMSFEGILKRWLRRPSADEPVECLCHALAK